MKRLDEPTIQERPYLDLLFLGRHFPGAIDAATHLFDPADTTTFQDLRGNPEAGRKWYQAWISHYEALEAVLLPDLTKRFERIAFGKDLDGRVSAIRKIVTWLKQAFHFHHNFDTERPGVAEAYQRNRLLHYIVDTTLRSILLKWFFALARNTQHRPAVLERNRRLQQALAEAPSEEHRYLMRILNDAEAYFLDLTIFREAGKLLREYIRHSSDHLAKLQRINDQLAKNISDHQTGEVPDCYNVQTALTTKPLLTLFAACAPHPFHGWEGRAMGVLSMDPQAYEHLFQQHQLPPEVFTTGALLHEQALRTLRETEGAVDPLRRGAARAIAHVVKEQEAEGILTPTFIANSISLPFMIGWDGELRIPETRVSYREVFADFPEGSLFAEALRFHLLWHLRRLVCPNFRGLSGFTRILRDPSVLPQPPRVVEEIAPHPVQGHKRLLPEGWYASPRAVAAAREADLSLAYEVGPDGITRYIETYVRPYHSPGRKKAEE